MDLITQVFGVTEFALCEVNLEFQRNQVSVVWETTGLWYARHTLLKDTEACSALIH